MPRVTKETPLTGKTKKGDLLTPKEELFCQKYVETMGNGTQSALAAYETDTPNVANQIAQDNLRKPTIIRRISELLQDLALNDATVDTRLAFNAFQYENLQASNKAIEMYNKLKGRYEAHNQQQSKFIVSWEE